MRKTLLLLVTLTILISGCAANISATSHDEQKAIDIANSFLLNVVREDYRAAYDAQISKSFKKSVPFDEFASGLKQSREERGKLTKVSFDYFQPVPKENAIQLFYKAKYEVEQVPVHLVLAGDGKEGYKIIVVAVGNTIKYPPNMAYVGIPKMGEDISIQVTAKGIKKDGER